MMNENNQVTPVKGSKKIFSALSRKSAAQPRPQRSGGSGGMLRILAVLAAIAVVFGNSASTEITAQLVSSAILWGAVGYVLMWVVQYAFDASWEGDWGLFIARMTMPLIALLLFSTVGLSIATGAASRIATVTATAPPVQSASSLGGGLIRILGNVTQTAAATAASWGDGSGWNEYASSVDVPTMGQTVAELGSSLVVPANNAPLLSGVSLPTVQSVQMPVSAVAEKSAQPITPEQPLYTVNRGDSLFKIAQTMLGDGNRYRELCAANADILGNNCDRLMSGMKLRMPDNTQMDRPALVEWNLAVNNWQTKPVPVTKPATTQQNGNAFTAQGQTYINALNDAYAPARNAEEQAAKDAQQWNVSFNNK